MNGGSGSVSGLTETTESVEGQAREAYARRSMRPDTASWHPFRCDAQPWRDSLWIQPYGEIDYETGDVVRSAVAHFLDAGFAQIVVDLRKVTFIDSSGLRVLIKARQAAAERKIGFSVAPGPPAVQRLFKVTGTADLFPAPDIADGGPSMV